MKLTKVLAVLLAGLSSWVSYQAHAAYAVDKLVTPLNINIYTRPVAGSSIHDLYIMAGTSTLSAGQSMRLRILVPPGAQLVSIRGESNDWLGTGALQPVMGTFDHPVAGDCPVIQNGVYTCDGVNLGVASGGLANAVYDGAPLAQARYMTFILYTPASVFSLTNTMIVMRIGDVSAYNQWLNARPWAGGPATNTVDGTNETTVVQPTLPDCAAGSPTLGADLSITIPKLDATAAGLGTISAKLAYLPDFMWKYVSHAPCK